ncbi:MAG: sugar transferase [Candidatus Liptonbacteria bacterium]|nr:sugar transferase [Candidatus Liptonbacteria bacterium]
MFLLLIGDIATLYISLVATLLIRHGAAFGPELYDRHLAPFSIIFALWILVFYTAGLYDIRRLRNSLEFFKTLSLALATNALLTVTLFYLVPFFGIAPKTNLFIFLGIFTVLEVTWRRFWNLYAAKGEAPNKVVLIGEGQSAREIEEIISHNPQLGYSLVKHLPPTLPTGVTPGFLRESLAASGGNLVVIDRKLKSIPTLNRELYALLRTGVEVKDIPSFYESLFKKVPLQEIEEGWILENIADQTRFYDPLKRGFEFCAALFLFIALLPLEILLGLLVILTSRGPAIYKQVRVGKYGEEFTLYKFRTMRRDAERHGPQWSGPQDARVTLVGKILRHTHLDELPQLWNILRGDLSFVGPRPERPEFVRDLKEKVAYYEIRLLVKPGVTGWAQINYRSDITTEDVAEKIKYDIYYVKNRSPILDIAIVFRTLKTLFVTPK